MSAFDPKVSLAIAWRQLASFLVNPIGYLFILAFVMIVGVLVLGPDGYFQRQVADFGLLYAAMPWVLAGLLPALSMNAWASEREHGTEELLLTMPVTIADAVVGKFLAIAGFFTVALVCNVVSAGTLIVIGAPDAGQILANFLGWWILGLGYAALALLGSVLVGNVAIAFVLGVLLCLAFGTVVDLMEVMQPFDRGLLSLDLVLLSLAAIACGLGVSAFALSSRRWQAGQEGRVAIQLVNLVLVIVLAVNLAGIARKYQLQTDLTVADIGSLSDTSEEIIDQLPAPAEIVVVISHDEVLPQHLEVKAEEILSKARAIERAGGGDVRLEILRPRDPYDELGRKAREVYGLEARPGFAQTVVGNEAVEVFLGAAVLSGAEIQTIPYFDPGLAVEYELLRALRRATVEALPRPDVRVRVVVSDDVPAAAAERAEALLAWANDQELEGVAVEIERPNDAAAAAAAAGLDLLEVAVAAGGAIDGEGAEGPDDDAAGDEPGEEVDLAADDSAPDDEDAVGNADATGEDDSADDPAATRPVVIGAVVEGPRFTARLRSVASADEVDSQMRSAIRRARRSLPVVGVVTSQLEMTASMRMGPMGQPQPSPAWAVIDELAHQYEIRAVAAEDLDPAGMDDIGTLLVPLPSSLTPAGLRHVGDWIWHGRPALLLTDALPVTPLSAGRNLAPGAPSQPEQPMMPGMPPQPAPEKAGIPQTTRLLAALGIEAELDQVLHTPYKPGYMFREIPDGVVWIDEHSGRIADDTPLTEGVGSAVFLWPTLLHRAEAAGGDLVVEPLVSLERSTPWGRRDFESALDALSPQADVDPYPLAASDMVAHLALSVRGTMPYPGGAAAEAGTPSPRPVKVVVIGDTDFLSDGLYQQVYRQMPTGLDIDQGQQDLVRLRNVQFFENVIDVLSDHQDLLELRASRIKPRPLTMLEEMRAAADSERAKAVKDAERELEKALAKERRWLEEKQDEIRARTDIDRVSKDNRVAAFTRQAERRLRVKQESLTRDKLRAERQANADYRSAVKRSRQWVRILGIGIPALAVLLLILAVVAVRLANERLDIPASRDRRKA